MPVRVGPVVVLVLVVVLVGGVAARHAALRGTRWPGEEWAVVVCDVGQGESVLVRAGPASAVVVDTGPGPAPVEGCLRRAGVTSVPLLVLTHLHADHVGGLDGVGAAASVGRVWTAPGGMPPAVEADLVAWAQERGATVERPDAGATAQVGAARVDVLAPGTPAGVEGDDQDVNDAGLVVRVAVGPLTLLAVGDIGSDAQAAVLRRVGADALAADVTTVAHHGSADQLPAFYDAVGAQVAVASAGSDNTYGHPTRRALDVVAGSGAVVLSTPEDGDVALRVAAPGPGSEPHRAADGAVPGGPDGDGDGAVTLGVRTTRRGGRRPQGARGGSCPTSVPA